MGSSGCAAIGALVERKTRLTMLLHLPERHDAETVVKADRGDAGSAMSFAAVGFVNAPSGVDR